MISDLDNHTLTGMENLRTKLPLDLWHRLYRGIERMKATLTNNCGVLQSSPSNLLSITLEEMGSPNLLPNRAPSLRNRISLLGRLPSPKVNYDDLQASHSGSEDEYEEELLAGSFLSSSSRFSPEDLMYTDVHNPAVSLTPYSFKKFRQAVLSVYVSLLQGYRAYLNIPREDDLKDLTHFSYFWKKRFVEKHPRREDREFLNKWVKSQIFSSFVHQRLTLSEEDHFERMLRKKYLAKKQKKSKLESTGICGVMWKMGRSRRSWRKRFFMLQGNLISYFSAVNELLEIVQTLAKAKNDLANAKGTYNSEALKSLVSTLEDDMNEVANNHREGEMELPINTTTIRFPSCDEEVQGTIESSFQDVPTEHSFFLITPERQLLLAANSKSDRRSWIDHIRARTTLLSPNPSFEPLEEHIYAAICNHRRQRLSGLTGRR